MINLKIANTIIFVHFNSVTFVHLDVDIYNYKVFDDITALVKKYVNEQFYDIGHGVIIDLRELDYGKSKECLKLFSFLNNLTGILENGHLDKRVILSNDYILNCKIFEHLMISNVDYKNVEFRSSLKEAYELLDYNIKSH